jgi:hypothetical protein
MIARWAALLSPLPLLFSAAPAATSDGPACLPDAAQPALGVVDPFKPPAPAATEANAAGKTVYRQGKWEEARTHYRAALAADPDFLAPQLNVACSFVRQERFGEATAEVRALLERAYVPWAREVLEAADLGALKVRPEMNEIRRAMASAAAAWGSGLEGAVVFVGRMRAPLRVPEQGAGVFILNPHQEVFAFLPATRRYRQLTAEDGRVLAAARSPDGKRVAFVTAEKLIRGAAPNDVSLRGVALGELTLATMSMSPLVRVDDDVRALAIEAGARGFVYRIDRDHQSGRWRRADAGDTLVPVSGPPPRTPPLARLTASGAERAPDLTVGPGSCRVTARDADSARAKRIVTVAAGRRPPLRIGDTFGAGLTGLPLL